jgi:hypothetical protein
MGKLKRFEDFESLKANSITAPSKDFTKKELELQYLFANLRSHKVAKEIHQRQFKKSWTIVCPDNQPLVPV